MRINRFQIKNYKSILDSGEIPLDPAITALVGRNESGKTCILKALESFKGNYKYVENDLCLYSKAVEELHSKSRPEGQIEMITLWFDIENEDRDRLRKIDARLEVANTLQATKYFDNSYKVKTPSIEPARAEAGHKEDAEKHISHVIEMTNEFREKLDGHMKRHPPFAASRTEYESIINDLFSLRDSKLQDLSGIFDQSYRRLRNLPEADRKIRDDVEAFISRMEISRRGIKGGQSTRKGVFEEVLKGLPNIVYSSDIDRLEDSVPISEFLGRHEEYKTLSNLIKLSGLDVEAVKDAEDYAMLSSLRSSSTTITGLVNQSWTQEDLRVNTAIVRDKIVISIVDDVIGRDHPPSIRSHGFQWFLSFYINFMAGSEAEFKNTILLLDDLGVYLHPSGQRDLLRTLETISKSNQIVYSTHSPYMIEKGKLGRVRVVAKKEGKGTVIRSRQ